MTKAAIKIGGYYNTIISNKPTVVRIDSENRYGGWNGTNVNTNRSVRIKSARKLRSEATRNDTRDSAMGMLTGTPGNKCMICGNPTSRPEHDRCYSCWKNEQTYQKQAARLTNLSANAVGNVRQTNTPKPGDTVPVNGGTITLMGKMVYNGDIINRMTDRIGPVVQALRNDANALDKRGYHDYATHLSNLAYAIENDMLESLDVLIDEET